LNYQVRANKTNSGNIGETDINTIYKQQMKIHFPKDIDIIYTLTIYNFLILQTFLELYKLPI